MDNNINNAYTELSKAFNNLTIEEKRKEILDKVNYISKILNKIDPIEDILTTNENYTSENEYLCYLNDCIYNLENKIGNIFKSIS